MFFVDKIYIFYISSREPYKNYLYNKILKVLMKDPKNMFQKIKQEK
jgi:hypothetical protein